MPDDARSAESHATSPARGRWWASILGIVVYLVSISLCSILAFYMLGIKPIGTFPFDLGRSPQDNGFGTGALLAWTASGFVSALLGGAATNLIAHDLLPETIRFNLIAGLVALIGGFWIISLATHGFDLLVVLRLVFILAGGVYGIKIAAG